MYRSHVTPARLRVAQGKYAAPPARPRATGLYRSLPEEAQHDEVEAAILETYKGAMEEKIASWTEAQPQVREALSEVASFYEVYHVLKPSYWRTAPAPAPFDELHAAMQALFRGELYTQACSLQHGDLMSEVAGYGARACDLWHHGFGAQAGNDDARYCAEQFLQGRAPVPGAQAILCHARLPNEGRVP